MNPPSILLVPTTSGDHVRLDLAISITDYPDEHTLMLMFAAPSVDRRHTEPHVAFVNGYWRELVLRWQAQHLAATTLYLHTLPEMRKQDLPKI